jgi:hypothetical protein
MPGHGHDTIAAISHLGSHDVHPEELQFEHDVRQLRHAAALRLQGVIRARQAFLKMSEKKRAKRKLLPAQDEHGHANPATIRYWTPTPMVHIHHHGPRRR